MFFLLRIRAQSFATPTSQFVLPILSKCIEDKHTIFLTTIKLLIIRSNLPAAIECGLDALADLDEDFPDECTQDVIAHFMEDTKEMLDGMSDKDLITHKRMTDPKKIIAMKFLAKVDQPMFMIRPRDQPIAVLKMVQISLMYGMVRCPGFTWELTLRC